MTNKFNVGDKVRVIDASHGWSSVSKGDEGFIVSNNGDGSYEVKIPTYSDDLTWTGKVHCFELISPNPTENQRITALEETVAKQGEEINELKLIVAQIRKPSTIVEEALANDIIEFEGKQYKKVDREAREGDVVVINNVNRLGTYDGEPHPVVFGNQYIARDGKRRSLDGWNISCPNPDVYELFVEDKPNFNNYKPMRYIGKIETTKPKTANQLRAEIIEKAKGFVEDVLAETLPSGKEGKKDKCRQGSHVYDVWYTKTRFVINEEKRIVVALTTRYYEENLRDIFSRGIAKCMPGDVFNEHIGKAIALGRALGLDVSEFEQAVQPSHYAVGHIAQRHDEPIDTKYKYLVDEIGHGQTLTKLFDNGKAFCNTAQPLDYENEFSRALKIINDTNAQYEIEVNE